MNTITVTINNKETTLILIGQDMWYNPRDPAETFKGFISNNVYMDPETHKVYIENELLWNSLSEYDFDKPTKIEYIGSKFVSCAIKSLVDAIYKESHTCNIKTSNPEEEEEEAWEMNDN